MIDLESKPDFCIRYVSRPGFLAGFFAKEKKATDSSTFFWVLCNFVIYLPRNLLPINHTKGISLKVGFNCFLENPITLQMQIKQGSFPRLKCIDRLERLAHQKIVALLHMESVATQQLLLLCSSEKCCLSMKCKVLILSKMLLS